jgi:hypothetical protein
MNEIDIDVRFEPGETLDDRGRGDRPQLVWGFHPQHGNGWILWYIEHPESDSIGVSDYFIPGDLTDVDAAVRYARRWLAMAWSDDD